MQKINSLLLFIVFCCCLFVQCNEVADLSPAKSDVSLHKLSSTYQPDSSKQTPNKPGVITAGEWNDLNQWYFWANLLQKKEWKDKQAYWRLYPLEKYSITLTDMAGRTIYDASVSLEDMQGNVMAAGRTDNSGRCVLFPQLLENTQADGVNYQVKVLYDKQIYYIGTLNSENKTIVKQLNTSRKTYANVDILFAVDATGSMDDELDYLKAELEDVISRVKTSSPGLNIRLGSVFYKDNGDEYVTRSFPFTTNIEKIHEHIQEQQAGGGGDFPEAVEQALWEAIFQHTWSGQAISRILFLILDAPPHDTPEVKAQLQQTIKEASKKGIRIIPITASGIDKNTEFLMRFMAIGTNGTYVFITDHSGIGNDHLEPTVGEYQVEYLSNLMTRLILQYSQTE